MNSAGKLIAVVLLGVVGVYLGWIVLKSLLSAVFALAIPVGVLAVVVYAVYRITGGDKALPGGRRDSLP